MTAEEWKVDLFQWYLGCLIPNYCPTAMQVSLFKIKWSQKYKIYLNHAFLLIKKLIILTPNQWLQNSFATKQKEAYFHKEIL